MDKALYTLLGAFIGSLGSLGITWIQQRATNKRELQKLAWEMAKHDREMVLESKGKARPLQEFYFSWLYKLKNGKEDMEIAKEFWRIRDKHTSWEGLKK